MISHFEKINEVQFELRVKQGLYWTNMNQSYICLTIFAETFPPHNFIEIHQTVSEVKYIDTPFQLCIIFMHFVQRMHNK
jgi:hypothetical protein